MTSVLNLLSKEISSDKPRWCVAAYVIYLQYLFLRFEETKEHHDKISKSLQNLRDFITKNKKI